MMTAAQGAASGSNGLDEPSYTEQADHPLHVVGKDREAHLGSHALRDLRQERCTAHPGSQRTKDMLDCGAPDRHGVHA